MGKQLAGTLLIRNGCEFGYCFEAAILSLQDICDHVFVVEAGSTDNTLQVLKGISTNRTTILQCTKDQWDSQKGKEKLSYFSNIAIQYAEEQGYEYQFNLQGDEVLDPASFPYIKQAMALGEEGFLVTRHNLWGSTETQLNVPQSRKPVSTQICRLTKTNYRSDGDAESVNCHASLDFINKIEVWHMGFVRDNRKHIAKIKEIQGNIFGMDYDKRADIKEEFDWKDWGFTHKDLVSIHKPLPKYVKSWVENLNK